MYSGIVIQEMVNAIEREQAHAIAARNGSSERSYRTDKGGLTASARYVIGSALVRVGRYLNGGTAPRPEPVGSCTTC
jgi:hypothetical protein